MDPVTIRLLHEIVLLNIKQQTLIKTLLEKDSSIKDRLNSNFSNYTNDSEFIFKIVKKIMPEDMTDEYINSIVSSIIQSLN